MYSKLTFNIILMACIVCLATNLTFTRANEELSGIKALEQVTDMLKKCFEDKTDETVTDENKKKYFNNIFEISSDDLEKIPNHNKMTKIPNCKIDEIVKLHKNNPGLRFFIPNIVDNLK